MGTITKKIYNTIDFKLIEKVTVSEKATPEQFSKLQQKAKDRFVKGYFSKNAFQYMYFDKIYKFEYKA
jgi:hypothetical protein